MSTINSINSNIAIQTALGGTGIVSPTIHCLLVGDGTSAMTIIANGTTGQVLTAATGADPAWGAASSGGVPSIAGTANQITESGSPGATTLSIPSVFIGPGSVTATTTLESNGGTIISYLNTATTTSPIIEFQKQRSGGAITSGDGLGILSFQGYEGAASGYITGASITSVNSGTIAANRLAGNLVFSTHPDSATSVNPTARMIINTTGTVTINAPDSGDGLDVLGTIGCQLAITANSTAPVFNFTKARSLSIVSGDGLGTINFQGYNTVPAIITGAAITSVSSGTIAANRIAANLTFWTHPDAATSANPIARMLIAPTGEVTINAPDSGVGLTVAAGGLTVAAGVAGVSVSNINMVTINTSTGQFGSATVPSSGVGTINSITADSGPAQTGPGVALVGTANQISVISSGAGPTITFSTPSVFIAPGSIASTTDITVGDDLNLPNCSSSSTGVVYQNFLLGSGSYANQSLISTYGDNGVNVCGYNTFVGRGTGNFTLTRGNGGARQNTALGSGVDFSGTTHGNLYQLTTGAYNTALGSYTGIGVSSGNGNTIIGAYAGTTITTGSDNLIIGSGIDVEGGSSLSAGDSNNIVICNTGTSSTSNTTWLGTDGTGAGQQSQTYIAGNVQAARNFKLLATSSTVGSLTIGIYNALNMYGGNFFAGGSVNFTTTGTSNVIISADSGSLTSASSNTVVGFDSITNLSSGIGNCVFGASTLDNLMTGSDNVVVGYSSAANYSGSESWNIIIGNNVGATSSESSVLRIGNSTNATPGAGVLSKAYIQGITGGAGTTAAVFVNTDGLLGTTVSSRKYKENIKDMGSQSSSILDLRPVTFVYTSEEIAKGRPSNKQYGLIAEEVHDVLPDLVNYEFDQPESLKYHDLPAMLLNELKKAILRIDALEETIKDLRKEGQ
jgi:hypothetical protein